MNEPIDIVLPWVDGNDPDWIAEMQKYSKQKKYPEVSTANYRFRSWDNLQYIFRGIEKYMPWVNKVFFITCGQVPPFLNLDYEKLVWIKHEDYIPSDYLPTFNSNTIEMNIHRISGLSDNYILFNDDLFPLKEVSEDYYFYNNMVCDQAVQTVLVPSKESVSVYQCQYANNIRVINKYFDKKNVIRANREKWFCQEYTEDDLAYNKNLEFWNNFTGFRTHHMAQAYKKSTLKKIWDLEYEMLARASSNRFRDYSDLTSYVVRYWQLCTGDFYPRKARGKMLRIAYDGTESICRFIAGQKDIMVSIEDVYLSDMDFKIAKEKINRELRELLQKKSKFEK